MVIIYVLDIIEKLSYNIFIISKEIIMRTTLNIKDDIIKQVIELTGAKNKSQAVNQVLEAFVRERQTQKLLKLKGKLHLEANWKKLRDMELNEV